MADNIEVTAGTGTTVAADDIGGVLFQRVKLALGADGAGVDAVAGAGNVSTATQRVTLAADDPAVVDLAAIEVVLGTIDTDTGNIATSAAVMDDWDESDRAKVNPIVGQAGIAAGKGAVGATVPRVTVAGDGFETVAASQTDQMLGSTGAAGDLLVGILVVPATTSPGAVSIEDGSTNITVFAGGADSVTNLVPFFIPLGILSPTAGWEVTTGSNVSVIAIGQFT
jgi:hypothetical protein